jgi:uncharacterized protein
MIFHLSIQTLDLGADCERKVALIADTHTSARKPTFHPGLIPSLVELKPDLIFHAGDIACPESLAQLSEIAPCYAVRGNRDLAGFNHLPDAYLIRLCGFKILLTHGHAPLDHYLADKLQYWWVGFRFSRYYDYFQQLDLSVDMVIFGHTHIAFHQIVNGKIFINPGATMKGKKKDLYPSFVMMNFKPGKIMDLKYINL